MSEPDQSHFQGYQVGIASQEPLARHGVQKYFRTQPLNSAENSL